MASDLEKKAYTHIDEHLKRLSEDEHGAWFSTYDKGSSGHLAKKIMDSHNLISYRNPSSDKSLSDITPEGEKVIQAGGIENYLNGINELKSNRQQTLDDLTKKQFQKIDLEINDLINRLSDYDIDKK